MWLLDTNICIYLIKKRPERVLLRLRELDIASVGISSITVAELQYGVAKSARPEQNALALAAFLAPIGVEAFSDSAASSYGPVRADLERKGTPIGSLDLLIAAHALALGRTLVTSNTREFGRVVGLNVENWAEGEDERR
jgi:tRNA(fMet)-specific endonuclease VapC